MLRDARAVDHRIAIGDIEVLEPISTSLMPELLVRDLTAQQVADLVAYLHTLREVGADEPAKRPQGSLLQTR